MYTMYYIHTNIFIWQRAISTIAHRHSIFHFPHCLHHCRHSAAFSPLCLLSSFILVFVCCVFIVVLGVTVIILRLVFNFLIHCNFLTEAFFMKLPVFRYIYIKLSTRKEKEEIKTNVISTKIKEEVKYFSTNFFSRNPIRCTVTFFNKPPQWH